MSDGSDAIGDWPILNALIECRRRARPGCRFTTAGASASAIPYMPGMVIVADGTPDAAKRLERVLTNDPGMGVVRHVDAGYERAVAHAKELGPKIPIWPMETGE